MGMFIGSSDSPMWKRGWRFFSNKLHLASAARQFGGRRGAGGPAADNDDVAVQAAIRVVFL